MSIALSEKGEEGKEKKRKRKKEQFKKTLKLQDKKLHFLKKMPGTILLTVPYFSNWSLFNYSNFMASIVTFPYRQKENRSLYLKLHLFLSERITKQGRTKLNI